MGEANNSNEMDKDKGEIDLSLLKLNKVQKGRGVAPSDWFWQERLPMVSTNISHSLVYVCFIFN